jgi:splicing suppressor protein 51
MADTATIPKCAACNKTNSDSAAPLKLCAKCQTTPYCSRDCQKADWKNHKKVCASNAAGSANTTASSSSSPSGSAPKGLTVTINKPFHRLNDKAWLHDRPENDVYKLLIDTYRFRMQDNFTLEGDRSKGSIYAGEADGRVGFDAFLQMATIKGLLPSWWSKEKADECMALGLDNGSWSSLARKVEKSQLIEHYGNGEMPMQLRLFGEQVYGRGPGGQNGDMVIMMQMQVEKDEGVSGSVMDASSMFGRR